MSQADPDEDWDGSEDSLARQCDSLAQQCDSLAQQCDSLAQQCDSLAQQCDSLAQQCDSLAQQCDSLAQQCDSEQEWVDDLQDAGEIDVSSDPGVASPPPTMEHLPIPYKAVATIVFNQLLDRAAKYHNVDMYTDPIEDFLFDTFPTSEKNVRTLPMLKGVLKHAPDIFKDPARARVLNPSIQKKYKAAPTDPTYIKSQLPLDSLVVANARKRANSQTTGNAPPPVKESKILEAPDKRVASQAANSWRIANTQALLARYDGAHYDELEGLLQHLPEPFKAQANDLIQEGKFITNASIKCAPDTADTSARSINTSVLLRRHAWLRISGFKNEVQSTILKQPVNQDFMFGPAVDTILDKMKKDTETAKSMGALQFQQHRGSFRRSSYRGSARVLFLIESHM
ncbi:uncharacterized protein LOC144767299 [Lissotriton helveticus]